MIIEGIEFNNEKGAFIVGGNSSGKSTILNKISNNKKNKMVDVDGTNIPLIHIDSEITMEEFKGKTGNVNKFISSSISEIASNVIQPEDLFNVASLHDYKMQLEEETNAKKIENILDTGMDIVYETKIRTTDLVSGSVKIRYHGDEFDLDQASSGIKILFSLATKKTESPTTQNVILIDEIENFLHPEWIQIAALLINRLIESGNKVILVSHSPILISLLLKWNPDLLSFIKKNPAGRFGIVNTWDFNNLKNEVLNIINTKPTFLAIHLGP